MSFNILQIILIFLIAFLAGCEGILDEWQFHQPLIACTLIGLVAGGHNVSTCIMLGGQLQMIALGWANVGAAVAPDAALAAVASAIILVLSGGTQDSIGTAIGLAVPLAVAGLFLTMLVRTVCVPIVHREDAAAEKGDFKAIEMWQWVAICLQGLRIAIPALLLMFIPSQTVMDALAMMPKWLTEGMTIGGGMVVAVGYAMVINMMANNEVWPFFALGFALAAISQLTLIALGVIAVALALIYLKLSEKPAVAAGGQAVSGDPLGDILNDY